MDDKPTGGGAPGDLIVKQTDAWSTGFVTHAEFRALADLESWTIEVALDAEITNIWNAAITAHVGNVYTITGLGYNSVLARAQGAAFGFQAAGTDPEMTLLGVNGVAAGETPALDPQPDPEPDPQPEPEPEPDPDPQPDPDPDPQPDPGPDPQPASTAFSTEDYAAVLDLSMRFYYAQYSGDLPEDFPIDWRGDSALGDGADVGRDLTGGWYDAGDHVKFGLPMAASATLLAWGAKDHAEGYEAAGAKADVLAHLEWVTDYFLRAYDDGGTADLSDDVFHAQVGDGHLDHAYWGPPEDMTMNRPAFAVTAENPGTEVSAETAAALAASAIVLDDAGRGAAAEDRLDAAIRLYAFAETYQGRYSDAVPNARSFYNSWSGYQDELAWGAAWLFEATGDAAYLDKAQAAYRAPGNWALSWDDKSVGTAVLLARQTGEARYLDDLQAHLDHWLDDIARTPGTATNEGLAWLDAWGANRYAANTAFIAVQTADLMDDAGGSAARSAALRDFATDQIDYMLGDNPDGQSYVVGFGDDYPLNPHHRAASGTSDVNDPAPNAHVLSGALVGGPDAGGTYRDERGDYVANEVATDYNAGFSGVLAALIAEDGLF